MISLFPHNETAYNAAQVMLTETGKAAIIHPTGTGKSFIGFKLCENHENEQICWLSPSSYIYETQIENLKKVTGGYAPENIVFFTYAKLMLMSEEEMAEIRPDYIILDEFHRCGAEMWGEGVQRFLSAYPNVPILGLSATNIRYLDNQRDMADELFGGNIASEITLGEAIVRGILNPPKYVLSVFSYQKDLEKYQQKVRKAKNKAVRDAAEKYLDALRRALEKADGLDEIFAKHMDKPDGKYIVFTANANHMQEMIDKVPEWFSQVDHKPHVYSAYSDDPATSQAFSDFKADYSNHLKLLFCIDMLNEGVHVDDIDGVILLRPTISPIIYKQQIGRALSASSKTNAVIFDIVNNFENLYSISAIQEEMQVAINYYRDLGEGEDIVNEHFQIIDEVRDCKKLFDSLNDTLEASWDMMYDYAKEYYKTNGNLNIPRRYKTADGYSLGNWLETQKRVKSGKISGHLSEERITKLEAIGIIWQSISDYNWERNFSALHEYYEKYGNIDIKVDYVTDSGILLGRWLCNLRTWQASGVKNRYLTSERLQRLNDLGMIWDKFDYLFEKNYEAAANYYKIYGNLDIPVNYVCPDTRLKIGAWIVYLRNRNAYQSLSCDKKLRLEAIGMQWENKYIRQWNKGLEEAAAYYKMYGNLNVPITYYSSEGFNLYHWLSNQREAHKAGRLKPERAEALSKLGFIFEKEDSWQVRYHLAKAYYDDNGTIAGMPANYAPDGIWINKWLNEQKQIYRGKRKGKTLTEYQIRLLEDIGIIWEAPAEVIWKKHYEDARKFYIANNHLNVSEKLNISLSRWLNKQRRTYKQGHLSKEQITMLENIGIQWENDDPWEKGYIHAQEYYVQNANLMVPGKYECSDGYNLGGWIKNQRQQYSERGISEDQIQRLESIGMVWNSQNHLWQKSYRMAKEFFERNHHLNVPRNYKKEINYDLNEWFRQQREADRNGTLTDDRRKLLEDIKFDWLYPTERAWESRYISAQTYFKEKGNLNVPVTYRDKAGFMLGKWIQTQRKNKAKLSDWQINKLTEIGMEW